MSTGLLHSPTAEEAKEHTTQPRKNGEALLRLAFTANDLFSEYPRLPLAPYELNLVDPLRQSKC